MAGLPTVTPGYVIYPYDCVDAMLHLVDPGSVHCVVTSPPYYNLRDYQHAGQIGHEATPDEYVAAIVRVARAVRQVLRDDGTFWLNLGDSYNAAPNQRKAGAADCAGYKQASNTASRSRGTRSVAGLAPKQLLGIPWRVALALQADGWYLRQDIIWSKPNPMPESVQDRCTRSHEFIFMLTKSPRYFYDAVAIRTPPTPATIARITQAAFDTQTGGEKDYGTTGQNPNRSMRKTVENVAAKLNKQRGHGRRYEGFNDRWDAMTRAEQMALGSNKRSVWTVSPKPYRGAHFATFPPDLIEPCILAGCPEGGTVLDPFGGSGTTALVALRHGRSAILCELNPEYVALAHARIAAGK